MLTGAASSRPRSVLLGRSGILLALALLVLALLVLALLVLALLVPVASAQASTLTVTSTEDPGSPTCAAGNCTLRAAIAKANQDGGNDTIQIPAGAYHLKSGKLSITASMTLAGAGARSTTIFAAPNSQIITIGGANTVSGTLADLTLEGATVEHVGGAVEGSGAAAITIDRAIIAKNKVTGALDGGAVYDVSTGRLLIESSTLSENVARGGGALDGTAPMRVVNSTLAFNTARNDGGAFEVSQTELLNDTVSGNKCENGAKCGGAVNAVTLSTGTPVKAADTIIAGNTDGNGSTNNCIGEVEATGPDLENGTDCNFSEGGGIQSTNPLLGPLGDHGGATPTMLLEPGSPAIDAGSNATCAPRDQRGGARPAPVGGRCDIGAVEANSLADIEITGTASPTTLAPDGHIEYHLTVTNHGPDPVVETTVENVLPAGATFVQATDPAGACLGSTTLKCSLGTLAPGASTTVTVSATVGQAGTATDAAKALAPATDVTPADNQISIPANVVAPVSPTVTSVTPSSGRTAGGVPVTIKGSGFVTGATVMIGTAATSVSVLSETEITATTAAHAAGEIEVVVTDSHGSSSGGPTYTYVGPVGVAALNVQASPNVPLAQGPPSVLLAPLTPVISQLTISPARFGVGSGATALTAPANAPRGTTINFTVNEPAGVRLVLRRELSGRRHGGLCLAATAGERLRKGTRCTLLVLVGTLTRTGTNGANSVAFSGRVGSHPLRPGRYVAILTAVVPGGPASVPTQAGFTIVH
jgi:uncharacterized repeat protein (TIGR01451 family)/CSLREA domain-containing protein